jgi:hypothetical protein
LFVSFRSSKTSRLQDVLATLRNDGFTTRDLHEFIIKNLCKCECEFPTTNQIIEKKYLEWIINLSDKIKPKIKILKKIKQDLLDIYEKIKENESKHIDFMIFLKFLRICAIETDTSSALNTFLNTNIQNLGFNIHDAYTMILTLPIPEDSIGRVVGRRGANLRKIESEYRCQIKIIKHDDINRFIDAKVWADSFEHFDKIKTRLFLKLLNLGFDVSGGFTLEFKLPIPSAWIGKLVGKKGYQLKTIQYSFKCHIKITPCNPFRYVYIRVWADNEEAVYQTKKHLLQQCEIIKKQQCEWERELELESKLSYDDIDDLLDIKYLNSKSYSRKYGK